MADLEFDEFEGEYGAPGYGQADVRLDRAKRLVNMTGAVCSVALVLGLGLWGYQLAVRDVAGVPVMRALVGPMRVAPADPGGDQASNQGLSVNAIAASGTAAPPSEQLTLAPRPIELQPDDGTGLQTPGQADQIDVVEVSLQITSSAEPGTLASAAITDTAPLDEGGGTLTIEATGQAVDPFNAEQVNADQEVGSVAVSLRPRARPASMSAAAEAGKPANVQTVSAPAPATELDPATLQIGTRLAQLGAFDTPELARLRFAELQAEYGELLVGKAVVIQTAQSGGRTFYRLRAHGFAGEDDARQFCAALVAENTPCIPALHR